MASGTENGTGRTELVYLPRATAMPMLLAAGLVLGAIGLYSWAPWGVAGAVLIVVSLAVWIHGNSVDRERMPRRQEQVTTARVPE